MTVALERAQRLRMLRAMTGLSRDRIEKRYAMAKSTLQNWENAANGGLTQKGATRMATIFRAEHIECQVNWLLHGMGDMPQKIDPLAKMSPLTTRSHQYQERMMHEFTALHEQDPDMMQYVHKGTAMEPNFPDGCHVIARKVDTSAQETLLGQDCLICTQEEGLLVRRVFQGSSQGCYHLLPLVLSPSNPVLTDVEPVFMAKIHQVRAAFFTYQAQR